MALWIFMHAEKPFDYMVRSPLSATAVLAIVFFFMVRCRLS